MTNPVINRVSGVPTSVRSGDTFTVTAEVEQRTGGDPWATSAGCTTPTLDPTGWRTPVRVTVDGETVTERELCIPGHRKKEAELSVTIRGEQGSNHEVTVEVIKIEDFSYDLKGPQRTVNDDLTKTVQIDSEAEDPSGETPREALLGTIEDIAGALGTSVTTLAIGALGAVILLGVI